MLNFLDNKCPSCHEGKILDNIIMLNKQCPTCDYVFEREPGAFTGALYLNLTVTGLSTFPFFCLLFLPGNNIFGVATLTVLWLIFISPFTLRYSKIAWAKMLFKQNQKAL